MGQFAEFHFLRSEWLWLLLPALPVWWLMWRRHDQLRGWRRSIAPHLLPHLLVGSTTVQSKIRPVYLLGLFWLLAIFALAGPSWQREATPFAEDQAVLVILFKVTPSMQAGDVQPSRLRRAAYKIEKLLERRPDTRTALIAYAGTAHRVMPFTHDHKLIYQFANELAPEIMPKAGDDLVDAVKLGNDLIARAGVLGSMLLLADSVDASQLKALQAQTSVPVQLWAIAAGPDVMPVMGSPSAPPLDEASMKEAASALGGGMIPITIDDGDIETVNHRIGRSMTSIGRSEGERWQDAGYWVVPLLVLLALFWFRRGWVVRWAD